VTIEKFAEEYRSATEYFLNLVSWSNKRWWLERTTSHSPSCR